MLYHTFGMDTSCLPRTAVSSAVPQLGNASSQHPGQTPHPPAIKADHVRARSSSALAGQGAPQARSAAEG